jgi:outer membrane protein assembly factor BamB
MNPKENRQMKCISMVKLLITSIVFSANANAQMIFEDDQFLAFDGAQGDAYGSTVSMVDGVLAVGSTFDDLESVILIPDVGSVYLYDVASGDFLRKIRPDDPERFIRFGIDMDMDSDLLVVGSRADRDNPGFAGAAHLFRVSTGEQLFELIPDDFSEGFGGGFGNAVAIDGNTVVVGAGGDRENGFASGAAYVFDATTGLLRMKLTPDNDLIQQGFGTSVAIDNGKIVVGAPKKGTVYVFDATTGEELLVLNPGGPFLNTKFGFIVEIENETLVATAPYYNNGDGNEGTGGVGFIYNAQTGDLITMISPPEPAYNFRFTGFGGDVANGYRGGVAIRDGLVAISAYSEYFLNIRSGSTYLFDATTGDQIARMLPRSRVNNQLILAVAIENGLVAVGAPRDLGAGVNDGAVYMYDITACFADLNHDGSLDFFDIQQLVELTPDWNMDGDFNFFDITGYLQDFLSGCP